MDRADMQPLVDSRVLRPAETALALELLTEMDLLRLKAIARLYARGLPAEVSWEDLLQEALTRILVGSRLRPDDVSMVAFVAGIMRSLRTDYRRRSSLGFGSPSALRKDRTYAESAELELHDPAPGPERALSARQELLAIRKPFAGDTVALQIVAGLGEGLSAEQIRRANGISRTDYDSARKRMRRTLLREGLTCEPE